MSRPVHTLPVMYPDNGILATVPGQYVSEGANALPDPETAADEEVTATIDADWAGVVKITYRRQLARHRKHSHWYWRAVRADPVGGDATVTLGGGQSMARTWAQSIVDTALLLRGTHPAAPALDVLDLVMQDHVGTSPNFDTGSSDHTDAGMPFAELLRAAFGQASDAPDDDQVLIDRFAERYQLWQQ
jgi:hypothetical protein